MASKNFTEIGIERAKPPTKEEGRYEIWDALLPGLGLRVSWKGTKTFILMYRVGGRQRRLTLGRYTILFRLKEARDAARAALEKVDAGIDPAEAPTAAVDPPLKDALAAYIERQVKPNRKDWEEVERALGKDLGGRLGDRPISTVARADILEMLDAIIDRGAPVHANRVLTMSKTFFDWCVERGLIEASPAAPIRHPTREMSRERILDLPELLRVWNACGPLGYPFGPLIRLLILTAQRRDEVAGLSWGELDMHGATWTLPAARAKNDKEHEVALAAEALAIMGKLPRRNSSTLLFTTTDRTAVSGWSRAKARLDWLLMAPGAEVGPPMPIEHWTLHDLRRSAASGMAELGVAPHVVDKILNHTQGTIKGVAAIYNRHAYGAERRAALCLWGKVMTDVVVSGNPKGAQSS